MTDSESGPAQVGRLLRADPDALAIVTDHERVTRASVEQASRAAALRAVAAGVRPGEPLPLLLALGPDGIVGYLAGIRSGGAIIVLDPALPDAHLRGILERTGARRAIVGDGLEGRARRLGLDPVVAGLRGTLVDAPAAVELPEPGPETLARIAFTSGSTGRPKGVVRYQGIEHWNQRMEGGPLTAGDRTGLLVPFGPSPARTAVLAMVYEGSAVCPYDVRAEGLDGLPAFVERHAITTLQISVGVFRSLVATADPHQLRSVRRVNLTGEAIDPGDLRAFQRTFAADARVRCTYGLSEVGGVASLVLGTGDPVPETMVYPERRPTLDLRIEGPDGTPVPCGEVGELVLRSPRVAAGYWDDPELQEQRFFVDPDGTRGYRSGDLGRLLCDGSLQVLGRGDDQVSIRGTNVHLGTVEAALRDVPGIRDAAVVAAAERRGGARLVALLVPDDPAPGVGTVRAALAAGLPAAMVPSAFLSVATLPRLANGKLDRAAAGELVASAPALPGDRPFRPPATETEGRIAAAFADVLGVAPIGADDDFFDLGGDSLAAEELVARLVGLYGKHVTRGAVLDCPTVGALAVRLEDHRSRPGGLVCLHPGGDATPLFLAPGAGLEPFDFVRLAHRLGADRPVYSYRSPLYDRRGRPHRTVEAAADCYLRLLREEVSPPRWLLGGYSGGGVVALEMARRLAAAGEEVALLVCIDAPAPLATPERRRPWRTGPRRAELTATLRAAPARTRPLLAVRMATRRPRAWWADRTLGLLRRDRELQGTLLFQAATIARARYVAPRWPGAALIVTASENRSAAQHAANWKQWMVGPVQQCNAPGHHHSMLQEPHVGPLAETLRTALREADGR